MRAILFLLEIGDMFCPIDNVLGHILRVLFLSLSPSPFFQLWTWTRERITTSIAFAFLNARWIPFRTSLVWTGGRNQRSSELNRKTVLFVLRSRYKPDETFYGLCKVLKLQDALVRESVYSTNRSAFIAERNTSPGVIGQKEVGRTHGFVKSSQCAALPTKRRSNLLLITSSKYTCLKLLFNHRMQDTTHTISVLLVL